MQNDWGLDSSMAAMGEQLQDDSFKISGPGRERFHFPLFMHALLGGILAALLGRGLYICLYDPSGSNVVMVGLILAVISVLVLLACSLCELRRPRITMNHELNLSRILSGLLVAVVVFAAGCLCEFIYEWNSAYVPVAFDDYVFAIDDSESMLQTDPYELRYSALAELLDTLDENQRVGLVRFNQTVYASLEIGELDEAQRTRLSEELADSHSIGTTDIFNALAASLDMYRSAASPKRFPVVVLLSDGFNSNGYSDAQFNKTVNDFLEEGVAVSTVSLGPNADEVLLENLAQSTGGQYIKVEEASDLAQAFQQVSTTVAYRCLFSSRLGVQRWNVLYMVLRVLFLSLPGLLIGLFIFLLLQSRLASRQLLVSGAAGLLAGLVMEAGTFFFLPLIIIQPLSWILYSIVLLNYYDAASGIRQSKLEMDVPDGWNEGWEDISISTSSNDISRRRIGSSGRIDRTDDWGSF